MLSSEKILTSTPLETQNIGKELAKKLGPNSVVAFFGDLGTGKTTMIKGIVEHLGISPNEVSSPTFVYLNIYQAQLPIYHFDLYRIKNEKEFLAMGLDEFLEAGGICFIEWAEQISSLLPKHVTKIQIIGKTENTREIIIEENSL